MHPDKRRAGRRIRKTRRAFARTATAFEAFARAMDAAARQMAQLYERALIDTTRGGERD